MRRALYPMKFISDTLIVKKNERLLAAPIPCRTIAQLAVPCITLPTRVSPRHHHKTDELLCLDGFSVLLSGAQVNT